MKFDPHHSAEKYQRRKEKLQQGLANVSIDNQRIILAYLDDMERGLNVGVGRKGPRSPIHLLAVLNHLVFLARHFEERFVLSDITRADEEKLHTFFGDMRSGKLLKSDGKRYRATGDYVTDFKAFWHWHMKVQRKRGGVLPDICVDLDTSTEKPKWVYLTEAEVRTLCQQAKFNHRAMMLFLFDSGIRSPTELVNVRVNDLSDSCSQLHIREEASKTFGRRIRLLLCPSLLSEYIKGRGLIGSDRLFPISPGATNRYLKRLARRVLGDGQSLAGESYANLTMYDFRHSSACYWLPRYKSESALKYRFGWKKTEEIHYYTQLLGMKDTIQQEDMLLDVDKTEIQRRLENAEKDKRLLHERIDALQSQMLEIASVTREVLNRVRNAA